MENWFNYLFWSVFVLIIGHFVYRIIKNGGFKAAFFSQPIIRTVGEISGLDHSLMSGTVRVHTLGTGSCTQAIGLEFVSKSLLSYHMVPASLSVQEARKLISLLEAAVAGADNP